MVFYLIYFSVLKLNLETDGNDDDVWMAERGRIISRSVGIFTTQVLALCARSVARSLKQLNGSLLPKSVRQTSEQP